MRISITVVVMSAMAIAMVVTALIAFLPTHAAGIDGVRDSVAILRENAIGRVVNGIQLFFRVPAAQINSLLVAHESGAEIFADEDQGIKLMCGSLRDERGILQSACAYTPTSLLCCNTQFGTPVAGKVLLPNVTTSVDIYDLENLEYVLPRQKFFDISWDINRQWRFLTQRFVDNATEANKHRWIHAHPGYGTVAFAATVGLPNSSGLVDRRLATYLFPPQLETFMNTLGLTANARVVAVDATNRVLFANNFGEATEILLKRWDDFTLDGHERLLVKTLSNMTDPTVRKVIEELGGEDAFYALSDTYSTTLFDGAEKLFIDVKQFSDDFGLSIRVLVIMPERDFTETIVTRQTTTIVTVVCTLVLMLFASVAFAMLLTRPMNRLGGRMYRTASLQDDDDVNAPTSFLSEIADMQQAYAIMKAELFRMKSFLPQSLLDGGNMDESSDDDDNDDDHDDGQKENFSLSDANVTPESQSLRTDELQSTNSSRKSGGGRAAIGSAAVAGLKMSRSVHRRRVAVACMNLVGFHAFTKGSSATAMTATQSQYLTIANKHVRDHKGIVDSFQGDKVFASFGAVSFVSGPGKRAMLCCSGTVKEIEEAALPRCTAGVSAGMASVGNMGMDSMVRFNIVGSVVAEAFGMERLARKRISHLDTELLADVDEMDPVDAPLRASKSSLIVATHDAVLDGELEIRHAYFDLASVGGGGVKLVAFIGGPKQMASDEWMYQLEQSQKNDVHHASNNVFRIVAQGDLATAREQLASVLGKGKVRERLVSLCSEEESPLQINVFV